MKKQVTNGIKDSMFVLWFSLLAGFGFVSGCGIGLMILRVII